MEWVVVHWMDITSFEAPWATKDEALELAPARMWSAGVILLDTEEHIVVAGTVDPADEGSYGNVNAIPKGVIISIHGLEEVEGRTWPKLQREREHVAVAVKVALGDPEHLKVDGEPEGSPNNRTTKPYEPPDLA